MELSSQEAEIPMPLNSAYGGSVHGHGHMSHHHHHHYQHQQQQQQVQQDPPSSSTATSSHNNNHNNIIPPSSSTQQIPSQNPNNNNNNSNGTMPTNNINNGTTTSVALEEQNQELPYNNINNSKDSNPNLNTNITKKLLIRYRECQKNHAASMGGNATDGCGEFMPSGDEGTIEALTCSACNCHRNFHRKEIEGQATNFDQQYHHQIHQQPSHHHYNYHPTPHHLMGTPRGRKVILGSGATGGAGGQGFLGYPTGVAATAGAVIPVSRAIPVNMPYHVGLSGVASDQSDDHDHDRDHHHHHHHHGSGGGGGVMVRPPHQLVKKRFRTKFSQEQKEKMLEFAEKVGWKIQKQEESVVQQFCQEVGVKRRVLKVWMHNNKHTFAKKSNSIINTTTTDSSLPN